MKTKTTHTQGPWSVSIGRTISGQPAIMPCDDGTEKNGREIAICKGVNKDANARLIAAAPEMFSILKEMMEYWDAGTPVHCGAEMVKDARAILAKAEGR